jgi:Uncharacterized conserved protein
MVVEADVLQSPGAENDQNCEWEVGFFPSFSSRIDFLKINHEQIEFMILIDILIDLKKIEGLGSGIRILKHVKS